jgi:hypothetical protein
LIRLKRKKQRRNTRDSRCKASAGCSGTSVPAPRSAMEMLSARIILGAVIVLTLTSVAWPQIQPPSPACAPGTGNSAGQNLSDTLSKNKGVLCPPDIDPAIKKPVPEVGKMPVIPPPGAPGGNQNIQPK